MASVRRGGFLGRHAAQEDGHEQRRGLVIGETAVGNGGHKEVDGGPIEHSAIPFLTYQVDRAHVLGIETVKGGLYYMGIC